jgi:tetratricopeptide (TPR) repeat protein
MLALLFRRLQSYVRRGELPTALWLSRLAASAARTELTPQVWLAQIAIQSGEPFIVRSAVRTGLSCAPRGAGPACRFAFLQVHVGDLDGAKNTLLAATGRFPTSWAVWNRLGVLHLDASRHAEAIRCLRRAAELALTPRARAKTLFRMGECLDTMGQKSEAASCLYESVDIDPGRTAPYHYLASCQPEVDASSEYAQRLVRLLQSASVALPERRHLHYALGLLNDRSERPAEAFAHFHIANDLRFVEVGRGLSAAIELLRRAVEARIGVFTRDFVAHWRQHGDTDESPVFVVGMPRSGTTLVERILDSHSAIRGLGELQDITNATLSLRWELKSRKPYPSCAGDLTPETVRRLSRSLAQGRRRMAGGSATRIVTKMPEDFWDLGLIAILFPRASVIHCRRHPIATCFSCYMQNFESVPYATSLGALAEVYRLYLRIMGHWRTVIPSTALHEIDYEQLVSAPEKATRELCEFCAVPFEPSCLRYHEKRETVLSASRWQVRQPVYQTSVNRWMAYREFLGPLLALEKEAISSEEPGASDTAITANGPASFTEGHVDEPAPDQEAARQTFST